MKFVDFVKSVIKITLDSRGRIYLPKSIRDALKISMDEDLFAVLEEDCFCVYTLKGLEKKFQKFML
jgi:DNA-binding transcriptional regulator/RsmH inhibitor MraZ